ncbi:MAG: hypothetical protein KDE53_40500, partial [Caldilineaceae bacterium]|nr:hypothetical protein [Caldilineaceae bacterium]
HEDAVRVLKALRALDQWFEEERVERATTELLTVARDFQPDLFISEVFLSAAGLAAEAVDVPFVVAGWPAMPPKQSGGHPAVVDEARGRLERLCQHFAIAGLNWTAVGPPAQESPHLHLTYWSPRWYSGVDLRPQTVHVGGIARPVTSTTTAPAWDDTLTWVFITLGTSFGNDPNFFVLAARAAVEIGCLPILALAGQFLPEQEEALRTMLPPETVIEQAIEFSTTLPKMAAAIHHGGAGVTHALVTHAVPQIIVPHAADQFHQAQGVVRSGIGYHMAAPSVTVEKLTSALAQLLPDLGAVRAQAATLRDEFAALGGIGAAADRLEAQVTETHRR